MSAVSFRVKVEERGRGENEERWNWGRKGRVWYLLICSDCHCVGEEGLKCKIT